MSMPIIIPSETNRCQAITDILESVALEQTALSHILNAEGEKIQKVLSISGICNHEILELNDSVKTAIDAITRLEMILLMKLELCKDCPCECENSREFSCDDIIEDENEDDDKSICDNDITC